MYNKSSSTNLVTYNMKQYQYKFSAVNGNKYTIVASRYSVAKHSFQRVFSGCYVVVYVGRYLGAPVRRSAVVAIERAA
jgi:hypothetical protein